MTVDPGDRLIPTPKKQDADYVFFELTRTICPTCRRVLDGHVLLRDNKVYLRRTCPDHGRVEALVYGDAKAYVAAARFNKPGTIPLKFSTEVERGCPHDCGLCPDHQQHTCLGIIEINSACNMECPLCFANAGAGFSLTLAEVEGILDGLIATEGSPEMVQFSGGEPTIHPELIPMLRAAKARGIPHVMINTNGKRIAHDDAFLAELAEVRPSIYFQFDGFDAETYRIIRGEPDILPEKLRALDRLAEIDCDVILVPAIERGVNEHELGRILRFALDHPAVRGVNFQPAFHRRPLRRARPDAAHHHPRPDPRILRVRPTGCSSPRTSCRCHAASRPVIQSPTPMSMATLSRRSRAWSMSTITWTTSQTGFCWMLVQRCGPPWKDSGPRQSCPAPRRRPKSSD